MGFGSTVVIVPLLFSLLLVFRVSLSDSDISGLASK